MLSDGAFSKALRTMLVQPLDGPFHRFVAFRHLYTVPGVPSTPPQILSGIWSKTYGGRFTPVGSFSTCYLSLDAATALREGERVPTPSVHLTIDGRLSSVRDIHQLADGLALCCLL